MEKNELKKELIRSKAEAELSHYCAGSLYYRFGAADGTYQFPIATTEMVSAGNCDAHGNPCDSMALSSDLGTTAFNARERASMLWRWIEKAIDGGELLRVS